MSKKIICTTVLIMLNAIYALSQIDLQCNGRDMHSVYLIDNNGFYRIDSVDTSPTNPILIAPNTLGTGGISINNNLDSITGQQTMYWNGYGNYYFWNGISWINTGHSPGGSSAMNPGGTANYIFNLDGIAGSLYRYDGSGNGTLLISNLATNNVAIFDVATDSLGNFYLFYTNSNYIIAYNPVGIPIDTFTTTGFVTGPQCGFVILGNRFYALACTSYGLYEGIKSGNNINFTLIKPLSNFYNDMAACPNAAIPLAVIKNPELPHFAVYPNPARNFVTVKLNNTSTLEISNQMGILIETIQTRGLQECHLDISQWEAGLYFIKALSANKTSTWAKLVVQ